MTTKVYEAIAAVMAEMSATGIDKTRKNQQQGYSFRGIDDVYAALAPVLAKNRLCILPRVTSREAVEKPTRNGGVMVFTTLSVEFDLVSAEDGSKHTVCTMGEASDSGDKSTNKAMSAAYKYMAFQAFCIPLTGEDNDADFHSPDIVSKPAKPVTANAAKKTGAGTRCNELTHELRSLTTMTELGAWSASRKAEIDTFPESWKQELREEYEIQKSEILKLSENENA